MGEHAVSAGKSRTDNCHPNHSPFLHANLFALQRVVAALFGVGIGVLIEFLLHASHPPAAATSLLVSIRCGQHHLARRRHTVLVGISLVTIFGEIARPLRLAQT